MKASTIFAVAVTAVLSYASPTPEKQSAQGGFPPGPPGPPFAAPVAQGYGSNGIAPPLFDPTPGRPPFSGPPPGYGVPPPAGPWGPPPGPWGPPGQCPGTCGPPPPPPHPIYPPPPPFGPPPFGPPPPPSGGGCGNGGSVSCCNSDDSGGLLNVLGGSCQLSLLDGACSSHCCQTTQTNDGFSIINIGQVCDVL